MSNLVYSFWSHGRTHLATELWPAQRSLQHHTSTLGFHEVTGFVGSGINFGVHEGKIRPAAASIVFLAEAVHEDHEIRVADVVDAAVREVRILIGRLGLLSLSLPLRSRGLLLAGRWLHRASDSDSVVWIEVPTNPAARNLRSNIDELASIGRPLREARAPRVLCTGTHQTSVPPP